MGWRIRHSQRALSERNVLSAFEFAQKIVQAKDPGLLDRIESQLTAIAEAKAA
jgi:hypothetical protein